MKLHPPTSNPIQRHVDACAINWAYSVDGQKGKIVLTIKPIYNPRFFVGAISAATARAMSSPIPAPMDTRIVPARKAFICCAVAHKMLPRMMNTNAAMPMFLRPKRSESAPTKGVTIARGMRFARPSQMNLL